MNKKAMLRLIDLVVWMAAAAVLTFSLNRLVPDMTLDNASWLAVVILLVTSLYTKASILIDKLKAQ